MRKTLYLVMLAALLAMGKAKAQDLHASAENVLASDYICFGLDAGTGWSDQPYVELKEGGISLATWSNYSIAQKRMTEVDYILGKGMQAGPVALTAQLLYYTYPNSDAKDAKEARITAEAETPYATIGLLAGKLLGQEGWVADATVSRTLPIAKDHSLSLGVEAGHLGGYFIESEGSFLGGSLGIGYAIDASTSVGASAKAQHPLTGSIRGSVPDKTYFTVTVSRGL